MTPETARQFTHAVAAALLDGLSTADETERAALTRVQAAAGTSQPTSTEADEDVSVVTRIFRNALQNAESFGGGQIKNLVEVARSLNPDIPWTSGYADADLDDHFRQHFAYAEIARSTADPAFHFSAGLTLLGPELSYAWHNHPATEYYLCLGEGSLWGLDYQPFHPKNPGETIVHPSWAAHAMKSGSAPLLAPWIWIGDIDTAARMTDPS